MSEQPSNLTFTTAEKKPKLMDRVKLCIETFKAAKMIWSLIAFLIGYTAYNEITKPVTKKEEEKPVPVAESKIDLSEYQRKQNQIITKLKNIEHRLDVHQHNVVEQKNNNSPSYVEFEALSNDVEKLKKGFSKFHEE